MATSTGGTPYVASTDLVANYPTASLALANRVDVVASGSMSKKTASYTVTVADILAGTTIAMNSASATVITLPSTSLVNGMTLNVYSVNTGAVTFTGGTVTGSVNSITAQYSGVTLQYDSAAAVWWCLPFGSGPDWALGSGGTESTITDGGISYKLHAFTGNGTFTCSKAGWVQVLMVSGGGGGYPALGTVPGVGGYIITGAHQITAAAHSVTVGAGGAAANDNSNMSTASSIGSLLVTGKAGPGRGGAGTGTTGETPITTTFPGSSIKVSGLKSGSSNYGGGASNPSDSGQIGVVYIRYPN